MVKLTPELIDEARIFVNPVSDRELDLRGYKIPALENLGSTYNQVCKSSKERFRANKKALKNPITCFIPDSKRRRLVCKH